MEGSQCPLRSQGKVMEGCHTAGLVNSGAAREYPEVEEIGAQSRKA